MLSLPCGQERQFEIASEGLVLIQETFLIGFSAELNLPALYKRILLSSGIWVKILWPHLAFLGCLRDERRFDLVQRSGDPLIFQKKKCLMRCAAFDQQKSASKAFPGAECQHYHLSIAAEQTETATGPSKKVVSPLPKWSPLVIYDWKANATILCRDCSSPSKWCFQKPLSTDQKFTTLCKRKPICPSWSLPLNTVSRRTSLELIAI